MIDLDLHFGDDLGVGNLTYTIESNSDPSIGASILGNQLTLTFPASPATTMLTIRATDGEGLWVEQTFGVDASDPVAIYRLNAGGGALAAIDGGIPWAEDTTASNSPYLTNDGGNRDAFFNIVTFDPAVDLATTPADLFQSERWSSTSGSPSMAYGFPVTQVGDYEVRLYMGNGYGGTSDPGERVFSTTIEGSAFPDLTDLDLTATFGHLVGGVVVHTVTVSDGTLDIEFTHGSANNPMLNGIEILAIGGTGSTPISVDPIADQADLEGDIVNLPVLAIGGDTGSLSFSADDLPSGLQIEPTTGLIFGTIDVGAASGSPYASSVTVDDNDGDPGDAVTVFFSWTVVDPLAPVWIDKAEDEGYTARHECSFVQAGDRFYMFGGRENAQTLDTYDYASDSWSTSASAPLEFNHFQATEYQGLIWVIGAFQTNVFPTEQPAEAVWVFDPANDVWTEGPSVPVARRRGSAGLAQYGGKFYVVGGNTIGHDGGYVPWFDEFDPESGTWTTLPDAPHARDHFHAAVIGDALYVAGGRLSGGAGGVFAPLVPEVDVYDFTTGTWSTLPPGSDLPTPRAGTASAAFEGKLLVIGGEGGGQAFDTVEALDPSTGSWATLDSLNHARHGMQAIVSGPGVFVAGGSPSQGGGNQKNMEVYKSDAPVGVPSSAGVPNAPINVPFDGMGEEIIPISHVLGNQGIYVESLSISGPDAGDFSIKTLLPDPFLLPVAGNRDVMVDYAGVSPGASALLDVTYDGGQVLSVILLPEPGAFASLLAGVALLSGMARSRRRARG